eukprot:EG_transcript_1414
MRLGVIFVLTLAVSVILSSTATWGLTFSTSYSELRDMSDSFAKLAALAVDDFAQLVWQLITDSGNLVSDILEADHQRSMTQMNTTQQEFLHTTIDLMARARNATAQAQSLVVTLLGSFGTFIGGVIGDFRGVGTDYASRLRMESASRAQIVFNNMMQNRIQAIKRQVQLYEWGAFNLNRSKDQPQDDSSCTLLGLMCTASAEVGSNVLMGTLNGNFVYCDVTDISYSVMWYRGATADQAYLPVWPPYKSGDNLTQWKAACQAGFNANIMNATCPKGVGMDYPTYCNGTCGFDPRCRAWYTIHFGATVPRTQMSAVYTDIRRKVPVVTLSYPLYSPGPNPTLLAVAASGFFFNEVDAFLSTMGGSAGNTQLVAVILNTSDFTLVGTSQGCPSPTGQKSAGGVPLAQACDRKLQGLGLWLAANRWKQTNASMELNGTLWDVFPSQVDTISYFVAVGMNKTQVYAAVDAANQAANTTLQTLSQQQYALMTATEAAALKEMDAVAATKIANIRAQQAALEQYAVEVHLQTARQFNASRQKSAADLSRLISGEMAAIDQLKDYHLSQVVKSIGVTFGAVVGIFVGILLFGSYGTWIVTKQVQDITETMEDVANMKVEELQVTGTSSVKEVERIAIALGILVRRLAEYKSYMPAGLFQQEEAPAEEEDNSPSPPSPKAGSRKSLVPSESPSTSRRSKRSSRLASIAAPVMGSATRLLRRNVAAMVVNIAHFQPEIAHRSATNLESTLNRLIAMVHRTASKAQGNIDAILGDQVLVTFNAHFGCSDPPTAASNVAVDLLTILKEDFTSGLHIQLGLAAGPMYCGHLGHAQFKAMVAVGAPLRVASLLSHLSDFEEHVVLVCPSVAGRVKFHFTLQPVDILNLPVLGETVAVYAKSITISSLEARAATTGRGSQEWLYEVNANESSGAWATTFGQIAKAPSTAKAREELAAYLQQHPGDRLAGRLLRRLPHWHPRGGLGVAERPDVPHEGAPGSPGPFEMSLVDAVI